MTAVGTEHAVLFTGKCMRDGMSASSYAHKRTAWQNAVLSSERKGLHGCA